MTSTEPPAAAAAPTPVGGPRPGRYGTTMVSSADGGLTPAPFSATIRT